MMVWMDTGVNGSGESSTGLALHGDMRNEQERVPGLGDENTSSQYVSCGKRQQHIYSLDATLMFVLRRQGLQGGLSRSYSGRRPFRGEVGSHMSSAEPGPGFPCHPMLTDHDTQYSSGALPPMTNGIAAVSQLSAFFLRQELSPWHCVKAVD
ncbi:hypothetical protein VTI74DRAFT_4581 [Chaetomium olivicolor]